MWLNMRRKMPVSKHATLHTGHFGRITASFGHNILGLLYGDHQSKECAWICGGKGGQLPTAEKRSHLSAVMAITSPGLRDSRILNRSASVLISWLSMATMISPSYSGRFWSTKQQGKTKVKGGNMSIFVFLSYKTETFANV